MFSPSANKSLATIFRFQSMCSIYRCFITFSLTEAWRHVQTWTDAEQSLSLKHQETEKRDGNAVWPQSYSCFKTLLDTNQGRCCALVRFNPCAAFSRCFKANECLMNVPVWRSPCCELLRFSPDETAAWPQILKVCYMTISWQTISPQTGQEFQGCQLQS